jgi:hypothetical protein
MWQNRNIPSLLIEVLEQKLYLCYTEPKPPPATHENQAATYKVSFENMVESRRNEAFRSILVQVQSEQSCSDLHKYCSQYGEVKGMHHYSLPGSLVCTRLHNYKHSACDFIIHIFYCEMCAYCEIR